MTSSNNIVTGNRIIEPDKDGYFSLTGGSICETGNGDFHFMGYRLMHLNFDSPWSKKTYVLNRISIQAAYSWCKKGADGIYYGEFNHPKLYDEAAYPTQSARYERLQEISAADAVVRFDDTFVLFEQDGELVQPGPWVVGSFTLLSKSLNGKYLIDYLKGGGRFRLALRSLTNNGDWGSNDRTIGQMITFDVITEEMDQAIEAREEQRRKEFAERVKNPSEEDVTLKGDSALATVMAASDEVVEKTNQQFVSRLKDPADLERHMTDGEVQLLEKREE